MLSPGLCQTTCASPQSTLRSTLCPFLFFSFPLYVLGVHLCAPVCALCIGVCVCARLCTLILPGSSSFPRSFLFSRWLFSVSFFIINHGPFTDSNSGAVVNTKIYRKPTNKERFRRRSPTPSCKGVGDVSTSNLSLVFVDYNSTRKIRPRKRRRDCKKINGCNGNGAVAMETGGREMGAVDLLGP